ncbi:FAD-dependent oxidoreductase [Tessaracoccus terricola]
MSFDVVVVGGGLAGWTGAVSAAESGARVLLLEKTPKVGGSTVLSGGFFALAGTPAQRALGIHDDENLLEQDLLEVGEYRNDRELVHAYAAGQSEFWNWLTTHGWKPLDVELSSGQSAARSHRSSTRDFIAALVSQGVELGVELRTDTKVESLAFEAGRVVGVNTSEGEILAPAVVLATGGFSRSEELLQQYSPQNVRAVRVGGVGSTGDGLRMALDVGAAAKDFEFIKGTFGTHPSTTTDEHQFLLAYYLGAIIVDGSGRRFVDESISYKLIGDACVALPAPLAYQVFDQAILDAAPEGVALFDPRPMVEEGKILKADTLEGLAGRIGVPVHALVSTVERYNDAVARGARDDFGRAGLVNGTGELVPLRQAPFYAYPSTTALIATYCGLSIDATARVLDASGAPIPGLWAVGEVTGGFHGAAYMTGSSLGKAAFFGIEAGSRAAAHAQEEVRIP